MKSWLSSRVLSKLAAKSRYPQIAGFLVFVLSLIWVFSGHAYSPEQIFQEAEQAFSKLEITAGAPLTRPATIPLLSLTPANVFFSHTSVITTIFWVGESANASNSGIANRTSSWDGQWLNHFGGVDDPKKRNGYLPAGFTPKENVFYFALPYSDIDSKGNRKSSAKNCPLYGSIKDQPYSWCKNSWIAIRHNGKVAYAQWEDAGPYGEDDTSYVFGRAAPANTKGEGAGLDVSPAVRDYLGLGDVNRCDWGFVPTDNVPSGPWKQIVTSTPGETVNN